MKQSSFPSRASNERSQTATKIYSEDRCAERRLSIAKIAPFALGDDGRIARAVDFPDAERRIVSTLRYSSADDCIRTTSHTRMFTAALTGE